MMMCKRMSGLVAFLLFCSLLTGCAGESSSSHHNGAAEPAQQKSPVNTQTPSKETQTLKVYFATRDAMYLVPEMHTVTTSGALNTAKMAMELLAAGPKSPDLVAVIPAGSVVRDLKVKDGIAYVDFSDTLMKKHIGGSTSEQFTVVAIVNTLTEFPDIHQVQILVDGKKVGTLAGHLDISQPLSRSEALDKK